MAPLRFLVNLIKFTFLIFPDPSGRVEKFFPDPGDAEKLTGSLKKKKKIKAYSIKFTFLIFLDPSGHVEKFFPDPGDAEKLARSLKKNHGQFNKIYVF